MKKQRPPSQFCRKESKMRSGCIAPKDSKEDQPKTSVFHLENSGPNASELSPSNARELLHHLTWELGVKHGKRWNKSLIGSGVEGYYSDSERSINIWLHRDIGGPTSTGKET
jgi:hypothetical protein